MINVNKSVATLKQMAEAEGFKYEEYSANSIVVHTKHNIFGIRVFYSHIDIGPYLEKPLHAEDYWIYHAWVVIE